MKKVILDEEKKDILASYERGEWTPIKDPPQETRKLREYARNTLQKEDLRTTPGRIHES